ncbi:MAG: hypothetical protein K2M89_01465 [Clostridiales bacterium]|nr:hypothetical protein [Clostridiales bacterium]
MENFFRFNVKTEEKTYAQYIERSVSSETSSKQESSDSELTNAQKKSQLPLWLRIIEMLCFLTAVCLLCGLISAFGKGEDGESFGEMWQRFVGNGAIIILVVGLVCLAAAIALFVWGRIRSKRVQSSPEYQTVIDEREKLQNGSYDELGVPNDADDIDVFCFPFKLNRKGKEVNGSPFAKYVTICFKIFKRDDCLYFADTSDLIKIPLSAVTETYVMAKNVNFWGWTKEQNFNSKEYKLYKIRANNYGTLFVKGCYCINLLLDGNEFEIIIPPYEWQVLEKYIQLPQFQNE